jgi:hypothetical protein
MLTKYDELLCHQTVATFDSIETSAREWTERIWIAVYDTSGECFLLAGLGMYANRNIMDAFTCVNVKGETQYNVRASRELRPAIDETRVGPFSYEIVEPLKTVRFKLDENEFGLSCDLVLEGTMPPHEEAPQLARVRGRVLENVLRFVQTGRPTGWIQVEGKRYDLNKENWRWVRDHSWGIRRGGGVPETGVQPGEIPIGYVHNFTIMDLDAFGVSHHLRENQDGKTLLFSGGVFHPYGSDKEELDLMCVEHNYKFLPDMRRTTGGEIVFHAVDGSKVEVSAKALAYCCLKPGGYFGHRGFVHGLWMGPNYVDGYKLDMTDPETVKEVSFLDEVMCELRCGDKVGYGIIELVVVGKYPKYGYQDWGPTADPNYIAGNMMSEKGI